MNIGIIGQGFVGNAIYQKFKNFYKVFTYDLDKNKSNSTKEEVYSCEVVFVCLPTPMSEDGSCHVNIVEQALLELDNYGKTKIAVIKSTIIPSTTEVWNQMFNLSIVHSPEFLTERNAVEDFNNQKRIILGGPRPATTKLKAIFSKVFPKVHIVKQALLMLKW